jgi:hypothetical protein
MQPTMAMSTQSTAPILYSFTVVLAIHGRFSVYVCARYLVANSDAVGKHFANSHDDSCANQRRIHIRNVSFRYGVVRSFVDDYESDSDDNANSDRGDDDGRSGGVGDAHGEGERRAAAAFAACAHALLSASKQAHGSNPLRAWRLVLQAREGERENNDSECRWWLSLVLMLSLVLLSAGVVRFCV